MEIETVAAEAGDDLHNRVMGEGVAELIAERTGRNLYNERRGSRTGARRISSKDELIRVVDETVHVMIGDVAKKARAAGARTHKLDQSLQVRQFIGHVTPESWGGKVKRTVEAMVADYAQVQTNGNWSVVDWGIAPFWVEGSRSFGRDANGAPILVPEEHEHLAFIIEIVDTLGAEDLQFENGRPTRAKDRPQSLDTSAILSILKASQGASAESLSKDQRIDALEAQLAELRDLMVRGQPGPQAPSDEEVVTLDRPE
jgi:hypothetical protein